MFHHPPGFIYASLAFEKIGLPYPVVPSILATFCHIISIRLAGPYGLGLDLEGQLYAGLISCLCPISWWCSQKYWLDNSLAAMSCACLAAALPALKAPKGNHLRAVAVSAVILSAALMCKVTAIMCVPTLVIIASLAPRPEKGHRAVLLRLASAAAITVALCSPWAFWWDL